MAKRDLRRNLARLVTVVVAVVALVIFLTLPGFAQARASAAPAPGTNVYRIPTTEKVCALTFDDWYKPAYLKSMLATLKATGADATFFPTGACVDANPALARLIIAAGYDIGSHSYSHPWLTRISNARIVYQIQKTEDASAKIGAPDPVPLFRTPYGAWSKRVLSVLKSQGYVNIMWSATAADTARGGRTASQVIRTIMAELRPGSIILMHSSHKSTPDALPALIRAIRARGYRIVNLADALFPPEQRLARYQQNSPLLTYLGSWGRSASPSESGGSLYYATDPGAKMVASFTGTTFEWFALKGPGYGKALVTIDGGSAHEVDLYSPAYLYRQSVLNVTGLADTTHSAAIVCEGAKNDASRGYAIDVDALRVSGELLRAPVLTRYEQDNAGLAYAGTWTTSSAAQASGGTLASADPPPSAPTTTDPTTTDTTTADTTTTDAVVRPSVTISFTGVYLAWIAAMGPGEGMARVTLDGGTPVEVDLYSASQLFKTRVYDTGPLADGRHTLTIEWKGDKNPASSGTAIDVDAVDILGTL